MNITPSQTTAHTLRARAAALAAVGTIGLGVGLSALTTVAQAQPKGTATATSCPIEIDGKMATVPVGSRVGLFYCGADGEWHLGWAISEIKPGPPQTTTKPVITATSFGQVQQPAAER